MTARVRNITLASALAIIGSILGIATAWTQLGWPRPAFSSDLKALEGDMNTMREFQTGTRSIVLGQEWWRLQEQIDRVDGKLQEDPANSMLREHYRRLQRSQGQVQQQIDALK